MVDRQSHAPDSPASELLSLTAFAASLYHAGRADNYFKFLKNFSEEDLANFLQGLLRHRLRRPQDFVLREVIDLQEEDPDGLTEGR
jgi:hypothetical protein